MLTATLALNVPEVTALQFARNISLLFLPLLRTMPVSLQDA